MNNRKVIVYIAMSLDGYIAKDQDDLSFLSIVEKPGEDYGYHAFTATIDTVIIGRKTYDWIINQGIIPHENKTLYVISRSFVKSDTQAIYYSGDLTELIEKLKAREGSNIYCDGGAELVNHLLEQNLIDEMIISVIPILLGSGIALFQQLNERLLTLMDCKHFETGLVQLHYAINKATL